MEIRLQREFNESLGRAYARTNTKKKGEEGAKAESAENAAERGRPSPEYMTEALIRRRTGVVRGPLGGVTELVVRPNRKDNRRVYKIENLRFVPRLELLDLSDNLVERMENFAALASLKELNLSDNRIKRIENYECLKFLERLNLSGNCIESLPPAFGAALPRLYSLRICRNKIKNIGELKKLQEMNNLQSLSIRGNPCVMAPHARIFIVYKLQFLDTLDGTAVTIQDKEEARRVFQNDEIDYLKGALSEEKKRSQLAEEVAHRVTQEMDEVKNAARGTLAGLSVREEKVALELETKTLLLDKKAHALVKAGEVVSGLEQQLAFTRIDDPFYSTIGPIESVPGSILVDRTKESASVSHLSSAVDETGTTVRQDRFPAQSTSGKMGILKTSAVLNDEIQGRKKRVYDRSLRPDDLELTKNHLSELHVVGAAELYGGRNHHGALAHVEDDLNKEREQNRMFRMRCDELWKELQIQTSHKSLADVGGYKPVDLLSFFKEIVAGKKKQRSQSALERYISFLNENALQLSESQVRLKKMCKIGDAPQSTSAVGGTETKQSCEQLQVREALSTCEAMYAAVVSELQEAEKTLMEMKWKEENEKALQQKLDDFSVKLDLSIEEKNLALKRAREAEQRSESYLEMLEDVSAMQETADNDSKLKQSQRETCRVSAMSQASPSSVGLQSDLAFFTDLKCAMQDMGTQTPESTPVKKRPSSAGAEITSSILDEDIPMMVRWSSPRSELAGGPLLIDSSAGGDHPIQSMSTPSRVSTHSVGLQSNLKDGQIASIETQTPRRGAAVSKDSSTQSPRARTVSSGVMTTTEDRPITIMGTEDRGVDAIALPKSPSFSIGLQSDLSSGSSSGTQTPPPSRKTHGTQSDLVPESRRSKDDPSTGTQTSSPTTNNSGTQAFVEMESDQLQKTNERLMYENDRVAKMLQRAEMIAADAEARASRAESLARQFQRRKDGGLKEPKRERSETGVTVDEADVFKILENTKAACKNADARAARAELMTETLEKTLISQREDFEEKVAFQKDVISTTQESAASEIIEAEKKHREMERRELVLKTQIEDLKSNILAIDQQREEERKRMQKEIEVFKHQSGRMADDNVAKSELLTKLETTATGLRASNSTLKERLASAEELASCLKAQVASTQDSYQQKLDMATKSVPEEVLKKVREDQEIQEKEMARKLNDLNDRHVHAVILLKETHEQLQLENANKIAALLLELEAVQNQNRNRVDKGTQRSNASTATDAGGERKLEPKRNKYDVIALKAALAASQKELADLRKSANPQATVSTETEAVPETKNNRNEAEVDTLRTALAASRQEAEFFRNQLNEIKEEGESALATKEPVPNFEMQYFQKHVSELQNSLNETNQENGRLRVEAQRNKEELEFCTLENNAFKCTIAELNEKLSKSAYELERIRDRKQTGLSTLDGAPALTNTQLPQESIGESLDSGNKEVAFRPASTIAQEETPAVADVSNPNTHDEFDSTVLISRIQHLKKALEAAQMDHMNAVTKLSKVESELQSSRSKNETEIAGKNSEIEVYRQKLEDHISKSKEDFENRQKLHEAEKFALVATNEKRDMARSVAEDRLKEELNAKVLSITELKTSLDELRQIISTLKIENESLGKEKIFIASQNDEEVHGLRAKASNDKLEIHAMRSKYVDKEEELHIMTKSLELANDKILVLKKHLSSLEDKHATQSTAVSSVTEIIQTFEETLDGLRSDLDKERKKRIIAENNLQHASDASEELRRRMQDLKSKMVERGDKELLSRVKALEESNKILAIENAETRAFKSVYENQIKQGKETEKELTKSLLEMNMQFQKLGQENAMLQSKGRGEHVFIQELKNQSLQLLDSTKTHGRILGQLQEGVAELDSAQSKAIEELADLKDFKQISSTEISAIVKSQKQKIEELQASCDTLVRENMTLSSQVATFEIEQRAAKEDMAIGPVSDAVAKPIENVAAELEERNAEKQAFVSKINSLKSELKSSREDFDRRLEERDNQLQEVVQSFKVNSELMSKTKKENYDTLQQSFAGKQKSFELGLVNLQEKLSASEDALSGEREENKMRIENLQNIKANLQKQLIDREELLNAMTATKEKLQRDVDRCRLDLKASDSRVAELKETCASLEDRVNAATAKLKSARADKEEIQDNLESANAMFAEEVGELNGKVLTLEKAHKLFVRGKSELEARMEQVTLEKIEFQAAFQRLKEDRSSSNEEQKRMCENLKQSFEIAESALAIEKGKNEELESKLERITTTAFTHGTIIENLENKCSNISLQLSESQSLVFKYEGKLSDALVENEKLREARDANEDDIARLQNETVLLQKEKSLLASKNEVDMKAMEKRIVNLQSSDKSMLAEQQLLLLKETHAASALSFKSTIESLESKLEASVKDHKQELAEEESQKRRAEAELESAIREKNDVSTKLAVATDKLKERESELKSAQEGFFEARNTYSMEIDGLKQDIKEIGLAKKESGGLENMVGKSEWDTLNKKMVDLEVKLRQETGEVTKLKAAYNEEKKNVFKLNEELQHLKKYSERAEAKIGALVDSKIIQTTTSSSESKAIQTVPPDIAHAATETTIGTGAEAKLVQATCANECKDTQTARLSQSNAATGTIDFAALLVDSSTMTQPDVPYDDRSERPTRCLGILASGGNKGQQCVNSSAAYDNGFCGQHQSQLSKPRSVPALVKMFESKTKATMTPTIETKNTSSTANFSQVDADAEPAQVVSSGTMTTVEKDEVVSKAHIGIIVSTANVSKSTLTESRRGVDAETQADSENSYVERYSAPNARGSALSNTKSVGTSPCFEEGEKAKKKVTDVGTLASCSTVSSSTNTQVRPDVEVGTTASVEMVSAAVNTDDILLNTESVGTSPCFEEGGKAEKKVTDVGTLASCSTASSSTNTLARPDVEVGTTASVETVSAAVNTDDILLLSSENLEIVNDQVLDELSAMKIRAMGAEANVSKEIVARKCAEDALKSANERCEAIQQEFFKLQTEHLFENNAVGLCSPVQSDGPTASADGHKEKDSVECAEYETKRLALEERAEAAEEALGEEFQARVGVEERLRQATAHISELEKIAQSSVAAEVVTPYSIDHVSIGTLTDMSLCAVEQVDTGLQTEYNSSDVGTSASLAEFPPTPQEDVGLQTDAALVDAGTSATVTRIKPAERADVGLQTENKSADVGTIANVELSTSSTTTAAAPFNLTADVGVSVTADTNTVSVCTESDASVDGTFADAHKEPHDPPMVISDIDKAASNTQETMIQIQRMASETEKLKSAARKAAASVETKDAYDNEKDAMLKELQFYEGSHEDESITIDRDNVDASVKRESSEGLKHVSAEDAVSAAKRIREHLELLRKADDKIATASASRKELLKLRETERKNEERVRVKDASLLAKQSKPAVHPAQRRHRSKQLKERDQILTPVFSDNKAVGWIINRDNNKWSARSTNSKAHGKGEGEPMVRLHRSGSVEISMQLDSIRRYQESQQSSSREKNRAYVTPAVHRSRAYGKQNSTVGGRPTPTHHLNNENLVNSQSSPFSGQQSVGARAYSLRQRLKKQTAFLRK